MALAGSNRKPALIAAARKISYSRADTSKLKEESWQERAWQVYDRLPAVFYMTRYRSDIASKVEYFVGAIDEAGMDPQVDEDGPAAKILDVEGGPELLRRLVSEMVVHWDVPGEGYLCRFDEAPFWRVLSTQELKKTGNDFTWGDERNSMGPIDADNVYRVWDPHPRFHWQADSPTRHIVEDAEELILLGREAKARSMSRLSAGILWLSDNTDLSPFASDEEGDEDDFARQLTQRMGAPLTDPSSAAALVPWVISAHPDDIAAARHMTFDRDWDISLELRRELLRSVATGLDLPPEILTGVADLNHWSAWLVSEMAVSQHVLPTVDAILDSLTTNWFKPLLEAGGVDPEGYVLWRDPSPATVPPDQSDVAVRLFELGGISGEAVRRVTNFDEDDAPTPEEVEQRIAKPAPDDNPREPDGPPPRDGLEASISPDLVQLVADEVERRLKEGGSPLAEAAVVAAVRRRVDAKALADIDRELLEWLVAQSQVEMDRLMVFASEAVTAATDPLDESLLARFRRQVEKKIAEAQAAARGWVENLTGRRTDFPDEEETRSRGVEIIIGGLLEAVRRRLFTPSAKPDPIDVGRIPDTLPPIDVLRRGMSVAGGGESLFEGQEFVDGIGNGQRIHDELEDNGFRPELMVWRTGTPSHPFDPHQRLEGVEFDTWDSPKLAVTLDGQWISGSHYRPNDHRGCQCSVEQVLIHPSGPQPIGVRPDEPTPIGPPLTWEQFGVKLPKDKARAELMNQALQRLNGLEPGVRDRFVQLLGLFDGRVKVAVATQSTKSIRELGHVFIRTLRGEYLPETMELRLQLSRQTIEWDDWVTRYNTFHRELIRDPDLQFPGGGLNEQYRPRLNAWTDANPEPDRWRLATPDELADVMVHELGHANDYQHGFEGAYQLRNRIPRELQDKVWSMLFGGDPNWRGSRGGIRHTAYEYATSDTTEMVAELQKFYLRGVHADGLDLTPEQWRVANPDLAQWVAENLLP